MSSSLAHGRSLTELVDAPVDTDWFAEVARLRLQQARSGAEAALRLRIFARAESALAGSRIRETAELGRWTDRQDPEREPEPGQDLSRRAPSTAALEVATALRSSLVAARHQLADARLLCGLPGVTMARLLGGLTSLAHVRRLTDLARNDETEQLLGECEWDIWKRAIRRPHWTPGELGRAAQRVLLSRQPEVFRRDHNEARRESNVSLQPEPETGMAWLNAYLPLLDGQTVLTAVDAAARAAKALGDDRSIGELRTEALRGFAERYLNGAGSGPDGDVGGPPGGRPTADRRPRSQGRPVELQVAVSLPTLLRLADAPAELPGTGLIPADAIRELAREAKLRLVTYDPDSGKLLDYGRTTYRPPPELAAHVSATWQVSAGIGSNVPARGCDLDHLQPYAAGGGTSEPNLIPLDRTNHRIRTHAPLAAERDPASGRITWTTPLGQTIDTYPYDWRHGP